MNLDRCLLFSWIEEDNIQKAYFRVRPLLTMEGDVRAEAEQLWPSEGCLRIVPDRNELHSFKGRMRSLGCWCTVDLRGQPADAGKIRTNKNFNPAKGEANQYILYSDTVKPLPEHSFYQIVDGTAVNYAQACEKAITPCFYIREGDTLYGPVRRNATEQPSPASEASGTLFELPCPDGETRMILCMDDAPAPTVPQPVEKPAVADKPAPAVQEPPVDAAPAAVEEPQPEAAPEAVAEAPVAPVEEASAETAPAAEEKAAEPAPLPIGEKLHILDENKGHEQTLRELDKPVSKGANLLNQRESRPPRPQPVQQAKSGQLGGTPLVPTTLRPSTPQPKNRLQELATSQYSLPYEPPTGNLPKGIRMQEVHNPVAAACTNLRQAWNASEAHTQLLDCIFSLDGFRHALESRLCKGNGMTLMQKVLRDRLQDLEAERLTALCELDRAHRDTDAYRKELLEGMKARLTKETGDLEAARTQAEASVAALKAELNALQSQRDELAAMVTQLQQDTLPAETTRLLTEAQMLAPSMGAPLRMSPAAGTTVPVEALITRMTNVLAASGLSADRNTAVALLALLALCPRFGVVCPTVAPLATLSRNIAAAFGWQDSYVHQYSQEQRPMVTARPVDAAPAILMTSLPNYAPLQGVSKVLLSRNVPGMVRNAAYDADPWPVLNLPALPYVDEQQPESTESVSAASLTAMLTAPESDQQAIRTVLEPVLRAAAPLSGAARRSMQRFISICAPLMENGFAAAVDWAILLWIIPSVDRAGRHYAAVKATLDEYPLSLAAL